MKTFKCPTCLVTSPYTKKVEDLVRAAQNKKYQERHEASLLEHQMKVERWEGRRELWDKIPLAMRDKLYKLGFERGFPPLSCSDMFLYPLPTWYIECPVCHTRHYFYSSRDKG